MKQKIEHICLAEKVNVETEQLVRFKPVNFDKRISNIIANIADEKGLQCTRLNSGAGHDAQMMARICPTSMVFVPSKRWHQPQPQRIYIKGTFKLRITNTL